jgi:hypothetical protein
MRDGQCPQDQELDEAMSAGPDFIPILAVNDHAVPKKIEV